MIGLFMAVGLLGGILTGLMSIGGGMIIIFLLLLIPPFFGDAYSLHYIAGIVILYTFFSSGSGLITYCRNGFVSISMIIFMGAGSFAGGMLGSLLSGLLDNRHLTVIFALLSLAAAGSLLIKPRSKLIGSTWLAMLSEQSLFFRIIAFTFGISLGILGGMFGLGAGFLYVPVLLLLFGLTPKDAVGTSLAQCVAVVVGAFLVKAAAADIPWMQGIFVSFGAIPGALLGAAAARKTSPAALKGIMTAAIVIISGKMWFDVFF